jgi:hypothetical protein
MNTMIDVRLRAMPSPAAHRAEAWAGLVSDLEHVIAITERIAPLVKDPESDGVLRRAYSTSASIAYARCFVSGVRARLTPAIFASLNMPEAAEWHTYFMDTRHKHVAHAEGVFEDAVVGCLVDAAGKFAGIAQTTMARVTDSEEGVNKLKILALHALLCVRRKMEPFTEKLAVEAMAMSPAQRLALPIAEMDVVKGGRPDLMQVAKVKHERRAAAKGR